MSAFYTTLDKCVKHVMVSQDIATDSHYYNRYLVFAKRGLKDITFDFAVARETCTVALTLDSQNSAPLPDDFVDWVAVGEKYGDRIARYHFNPGLTKYRNKDGCGNELANTAKNPMNLEDLALGGYWFGPYYNSYMRNGEFVGGIYGATDGTDRPTFEIDYKRCEIFFSSDVSNARDVILMEYLPLEWAAGKDTQIHIYFEEAMIAFIYWASIENKEGVSQAEKQRAMESYRTKKKFANRNRQKQTWHDLLENARRSTRATPRK